MRLRRDPPRREFHQDEYRAGPVVVGLAGSIAAVEVIAENALSGADEGVRVRHDVGTEALVCARVDPANERRGDR